MCAMFTSELDFPAQNGRFLIRLLKIRMGHQFHCDGHLNLHSLFHVHQVKNDLCEISPRWWWLLEPRTQLRMMEKLGPSMMMPFSYTEFNSCESSSNGRRRKKRKITWWFHFRKTDLRQSEAKINQNSSHLDFIPQTIFACSISWWW